MRLTSLTELFVFLVGVTQSLGFQTYHSLAGLSERELAEIVPRLQHVTAGPPPGPIAFNGTKLVHDKAHPWKPLRPGDQRGPCPGLNVLASHGYLPRDGIATPEQIVTAAQEGFNMEYRLAVFSAYTGLLVDGNVVTNLLSIGGKTPRTGPDPPSPAIVGGLNTHAVLEGDASTTRADAFFGDNHSFNQTLFDQFVDFSQRYGGGFYDINVAKELRYHLIQQSIATNPNFSFVAPRYFSGYGESVIPINLFVDGRSPEKKLSMEAALSIFRDYKFPDDFHRAAQPSGLENIADVALAHPVVPGRNVDGVNTYTHDPNSADLTNFCLLYYNFVNQTVKGLYPAPTGVLRRNLAVHLHNMYLGIEPAAGCEELFPYGQP